MENRLSNFVNGGHGHLSISSIEATVGTKYGYCLQEKLWSDSYEVGQTICMKGPDFSYQCIQVNGFTRPVLVKKKEGLGLIIPASNFTADDVMLYVSRDYQVVVTNVTTKASSHWSMWRWIAYLNDPHIPRPEVLSVNSFEITDTGLDPLVEAPLVVREMDWIEKSWPLDLRYKVIRKARGEATFPKALKYCLMSVGGCFTDFRIELGGASVWHHILKGKKVFWLIPPTEENLRAYEAWCLSGSQERIFLADSCKGCQRITINHGHTFFIPTGWIHADFSPIDSIVFKGNFLHIFNIGLQLKVAAMEQSLKRLEFPFYNAIHWYIFDHYSIALTGVSFCTLHYEHLGISGEPDGSCSASWAVGPAQLCDLNGEGSLSRAEILGLRILHAHLCQLPDRSWPGDLVDPKGLLSSMAITLYSLNPDCYKDALVPGCSVLQWKAEVLSHYKNEWLRYVCREKEENVSRCSSQRDDSDSVIGGNIRNQPVSRDYPSIPQPIKQESLNCGPTTTSRPTFHQPAADSGTMKVELDKYGYPQKWPRFAADPGCANCRGQCTGGCASGLVSDEARMAKGILIRKGVSCSEADPQFITEEFVANSFNRANANGLNRCDDTTRRQGANVKLKCSGITSATEHPDHNKPIPGSNALFCNPKITATQTMFTVSYDMSAQPSLTQSHDQNTVNSVISDLKDPSSPPLSYGIKSSPVCSVTSDQCTRMSERSHGKCSTAVSDTRRFHPLGPPSTESSTFQRSKSANTSLCQTSVLLSDHGAPVPPAPVHISHNRSTPLPQRRSETLSVVKRPISPHGQVGCHVNTSAEAPISPLCSVTLAVGLAVKSSDDQPYTVSEETDCIEECASSRSTKLDPSGACSVLQQPQKSSVSSDILSTTDRDSLYRATTTSVANAQQAQFGLSTLATQPSLASHEQFLRQLDDVLSSVTVTSDTLTSVRSSRLPQYSPNDDIRKCEHEEQAALPYQNGCSSLRGPELKKALVMLEDSVHGASEIRGRDDTCRRYRWSCQECVSCIRPNCGVCSNCVDMPTFGGKGYRRQKCIFRRCERYHKEPDAFRPPMKPVRDDNPNKVASHWDWNDWTSLAPGETAHADRLSQSYEEEMNTSDPSSAVEFPSEEEMPLTYPSERTPSLRDPKLFPKPHYRKRGRPRKYPRPEDAWSLLPPQCHTSPLDLHLSDAWVKQLPVQTQPFFYANSNEIGYTRLNKRLQESSEYLYTHGPRSDVNCLVSHDHQLSMTDGRSLDNPRDVDDYHLVGGVCMTGKNQNRNRIHRSEVTNTISTLDSDIEIVGQIVNDQNEIVANLIGKENEIVAQLIDEEADGGSDAPLDSSTIHATSNYYTGNHSTDRVNKGVNAQQPVEESDAVCLNVHQTQLYLPDDGSVVEKTSTKRSKRRRKACRECAACLRPNCGECSRCLDMPAFGGRGIMKQRCLLRQCRAPLQPDEPTPDREQSPQHEMVIFLGDADADDEIPVLVDTGGACVVEEMSSEEWDEADADSKPAFSYVTPTAGTSVHNAVCNGNLSGRNSAAFPRKRGRPRKQPLVPRPQFESFREMPRSSGLLWKARRPGRPRKYNRHVHRTPYLSQPRTHEKAIHTGNIAEHLCTESRHIQDDSAIALTAASHVRYPSAGPSTFPRKRGRPRKNANPAPLGETSAIASHQAIQMSSPAVDLSLSDYQKVAARPIPRKRGRPKKVYVPSEVVNESYASGQHTAASGFRPSAEASLCVEANTSDLPGSDECSDRSAGEMVTEDPSTKCPVSQQPDMNNTDPDKVSIPRKRGRPRKYPLQPASHQADQQRIPCDLTQSRRKRGRPRKVHALKDEPNQSDTSFPQPAASLLEPYEVLIRAATQHSSGSMEADDNVSDSEICDKSTIYNKDLVDEICRKGAELVHHPIDDSHNLLEVTDADVTVEQVYLSGEGGVCGDDLWQITHTVSSDSQTNNV